MGPRLSEVISRRVFFARGAIAAILSVAAPLRAQIASRFRYRPLSQPVVVPLDAVATAWRVRPFTAEAVTLSLTGPDDAVIGHVSDVPVTPTDVEILWATPGESIRRMPSLRLRLTMTSHAADAPVLGEYELDHTELPAP